MASALNSDIPWPAGLASVAEESMSAVLVVIRSKSVSICNHSRASLVDSSRNRTFSRGYPNLMRSYGGLLEPRGSRPYTVEIYD